MNYSIPTRNKTQAEKAYKLAIDASKKIQDEIAEKHNNVLVLGGYGANLQVRSIQGIKCLVYSYKKEEPQIFMPGVHKLKRVIWTYCVTRPSLPALYWLEQEKIEFLCINQEGYDMTEQLKDDCVDTILRRMQYMLSFSEEQERDYARMTIYRKVQTQAAILRKHHKQLTGAKEAAKALEDNLAWFAIKDGPWTSEKGRILQGEAKCSERSFECWYNMPIAWVKADEKYVHPAYKVYSTRVNGVTGKNYKARHPVNAMLNYMNALVAHKIKRECLERGLDTKVSFLHARQDTRVQSRKVKPDTRDNLVYDLIEPIRPYIESALLKFLASYELHLDWFNFDEFGVVTCDFMISQVLTQWVEQEIKDADISGVVDEYIDWLRSQSAKITVSIA